MSDVIHPFPPRREACRLRVTRAERDWLREVLLLARQRLEASQAYGLCYEIRTAAIDLRMNDPTHSRGRVAIRDFILDEIDVRLGDGRDTLEQWLETVHGHEERVYPSTELVPTRLAWLDDLIGEFCS